MKTTIDIRDDLFREAKEAARARGATLRSLVEEGLREVLRPRKRRKARFRLRIVPFKGDGTVPGVDLGNWSQVRDILYGEEGP